MRRPSGGVRPDAPGSLHRWSAHERITRHWPQTKAIGPPDFNQSPNRLPEEGEEEVGFDWGIATFATLQWLTSKPFAIVFEGDIELECGGPCPRGGQLNENFIFLRSLSRVS